ncbi:uncharacterized protein LOC136079986 [Hydra vulgaris]|uniref:Uncharacterized protein LOC136079986 n=1 Tax=Hydra vulgaris TaxID=6087 RepID=A0ABM4BU59_HYDVU
MFAKSFVDDMFEACKLFGSKAVLFISNDDKARIPLGLAAASLQVPLLMHMEYKVKFMDHDFVVSPQHKLIPSVYGICTRFPKTLATAVDLFRLLDLDALLHGVNAAGLSAFNPVELKMAPLSHDLAGIILPHYYFGNHLGSSGKTIDQKFELENFQKAASILVQVWEKTVIDGYPVYCQAVPVGKAYEPPTPDPVWVEKNC